MIKKARGRCNRLALAEGLLPFRACRIWEATVNRDVVRCVPANGVLACYVGDASSHCTVRISIHGIPPMKRLDDPRSPVPRDSEEFKRSKRAVRLRFTELTKKRCWT